MRYIHSISRKMTPTELEPIAEVRQKKLVRECLEKELQLEFEKRPRVGLQVSNNENYQMSWKTLRGSGKSKFLHTITGLELFKTGYVSLEGQKEGFDSEGGRSLRFEKGDILVIPCYQIIFGESAKHNIEILQVIFNHKQGRLFISEFGEITQTNTAGRMLMTILDTTNNIRYEKAREMNLLKNRRMKKNNSFSGGKRTPFGKDWKKYDDGTLLQLTPADRRTLDIGKVEFGQYINANGELVPNKMEQQAIREMRRLRNRRFSYMKISKKIEEHFGTNIKTGEPNIKISHMGVYRILNRTKRATSRE